MLLIDNDLFKNIYRLTFFTSKLRCLFTNLVQCVIIKLMKFENVT